jgi:hypothetical protein
MRNEPNRGARRASMPVSRAGSPAPRCVPVCLQVCDNRAKGARSCPAFLRLRRIPMATTFGMDATARGFHGGKQS